MAYTQSDLDAIDDAILAYGLGQRAGSATIAGHTVKFAEISLKELEQVRSTIAASVAAAAGTYSPRAYAKNGGRG